MVKNDSTIFYLLAIEKLSKGKKIRNKDLVDFLNIAPSSVTERLYNLENDQVIYRDKKYIFISDKGKRMIEDFQNKYIKVE
ncbi:metal-dependent transcriptional regulator [Enterococcus sp. DIV1420a]|uniref:metal-dependent transcriptional regulator n=1 Tax=Enterococcus sp. DIV1420a TaxID=2774672 RepID=UPI0036D72A11